MAYEDMPPTCNGEGKNKNDGGNAGKFDVGKWCDEHPWMTTGLVLLFVMALPGIIIGLIEAFAKLVMVLVPILMAVGLAVLAVKGFDGMRKGHASRDAAAGNEKASAARRWKSKDSHAPDSMRKLADGGSVLARNVATAYDSMLERIHEAGGDPDLVQAEYASRMNAMADGIALHDKVRSDMDSYPDADSLLQTVENAADALMDQFDATVRKANLSRTTDAELKMQAIMDATPYDDSGTIFNDGNDAGTSVGTIDVE